MKKDKQLAIRLTEKQIDFYKSEAEKYGLNMTELFKLQNIMFYRLKDLEPGIFDTFLTDFIEDVNRV